MGKQYIFTIANLTKKHGAKGVLKDIWLAFHPGAKIGVLGRNGARGWRLRKMRRAGFATRSSSCDPRSPGHLTGVRQSVR